MGGNPTLADLPRQGFYFDRAVEALFSFGPRMGKGWPMSASNDQEKVLQTRQRDGVLYATLNRPDVGNSLSLELIAELQALWSRLEDDRTVKVVVLAGEGRFFCTGHDLKEILSANENASEFARDLAEHCNQMMQGMTRLPQPVIARVHGVATAAGCQLVATCDLAVASTEACFATPGVNIGTWCSTPSVALSRTVGRKHAMQMLLTGRLQDAETALRMGLVNEVAAPDKLDAAVDSLADEIAAKSPYAIALGKRSFYRQLELDTAAAYEFAGEVAARNATAADSEEGIAAFLEKRDPAWPGR